MKTIVFALVATCAALSAAEPVTAPRIVGGDVADFADPTTSDQDDFIIPVASDLRVGYSTNVGSYSRKQSGGSSDNLDGVTQRRHLVPLRLVLIRGEWYCVAWNKGLGMYRMARMTRANIAARSPPGMPRHLPSQMVDDLLADSFFATGSADSTRRCRVQLAASPGVWPFLAGRTWGRSQRVEEGPADLPAGWRRLSFTTTGLAECRYWLLGFGASVIAEAPLGLVQWLRDEAAQVHKTALAQALSHEDLFPQPATHRKRRS